MLNKARSNLQQTRLEVKATIAQSQETISQYHQFMEKHKQKMEQKVDDYLKQNHFQLAPSESAFEEEEQIVRPKSKYLQKDDKKVEYKYAFGQKIPVDHTWTMRQPTKEEKEELEKSAKKSSAKKGFEGFFDGRPMRLNSSNSKQNDGLQQYKSTPVKMNPHLNDENCVNSS